MEPTNVSTGRCVTLAIAYGFVSLNTPEELDETKLKMGKEWKLFPSSNESMKHFYKL